MIFPCFRLYFNFNNDRAPRVASYTNTMLKKTPRKINLMTINQVLKFI